MVLGKIYTIPDPLIVKIPREHGFYKYCLIKAVELNSGSLSNLLFDECRKYGGRLCKTWAGEPGGTACYGVKFRSVYRAVEFKLMWS